MFEYRFIRFIFDYANNMFVPIKFDCTIPYSDIHTKFSRGISNDTEY